MCWLAVLPVQELHCPSVEKRVERLLAGRTQRFEEYGQHRCISVSALIGHDEGEESVIYLLNIMIDDIKKRRRGIGKYKEPDVRGTRGSRGRSEKIRIS